MKVRVTVVPRRGVLDPQGEAVLGGLRHLGFEEVTAARVGKVIDLVLDASSADEALARARQMGKQLLANEIVEDFDVQVLP